VSEFTLCFVRHLARGRYQLANLLAFLLSRSKNSKRVVTVCVEDYHKALSAFRRFMKLARLRFIPLSLAHQVSRSTKESAKNFTATILEIRFGI
jgi:hypothetical protein